MISADFIITTQVDPSVASGTTLTNTATISSATTDPHPANNSASFDTFVQSATANISVTKSGSPSTVTAGTDLTYTITVSDNANTDLDEATLTDALPAGTTFVSVAPPPGWTCAGTTTVTCTAIDVPAMSSAQFTLVVHVAPSVASGSMITNQLSLLTTVGGRDQTTTASTTSSVTASAALAVTVSDSPDPVTPGTNLTYTINVTNNGPSDAQSVNLTNALPAGTTFVSIAKPAGWSCAMANCSRPILAAGTTDTLTLVVNVSPSATAGTMLTDTSTATTTTGPSANGSATTTVGPQVADVNVSISDSPDPVTPGNNISYAISVTNGGPSDASTVTLTDGTPANTTFVSVSSPAGWNCTTPAMGAAGTITCTIATLAAGSPSFTLVVKTNPSLAAGTMITDSASVTSSSDATPGNASTTTTVGAPVADLSITKADAADPIVPGNNIDYTITVTNSGPSNASATMTDILPSATTYVSLTSPAGWSCMTTGTISCTNSSLAPGSATFTLSVKTSVSTPNGTVLTNTATVTSSADTNTANNSATATTTLAVAIPTIDPRVLAVLAIVLASVALMGRR